MNLITPELESAEDSAHRWEDQVQHCIGRSRLQPQVGGLQHTGGRIIVKYSTQVEGLQYTGGRITVLRAGGRIKAH